MIIFDNKDFYENGEPVGETNYVNTRCDYLYLEVSNGDGAEFKLEGRCDNKIVEEDEKQYVEIMGKNLSNDTKEASESGNGIWEFNIRGIHEFKVTKVSGDTANVHGRLIITVI